MRFTNWSEDPEQGYYLSGEDVGGAIYAYALRHELAADEIEPGDFIIWHTHPNGSEGPSDRDLTYRARGFQHLVVSLPGGPGVFF